MDEIINIKVNGNSVTKDYNVAGTQYEANRTKLRISFSENWSGYAKSVTFWNAVGENPVKLLLGTDLLENILESDSVYIVPIPGEAMTEGGKCSFVIEGAKDGVNARTVEDSLKVLHSPKADNAGQAVDPTPTQAEQLRAEMDAVMDDIASAKEAANEASDAVEEVRNMSVSCETLDVGATPTVDKSFDDGKVNLHFGIPTSVEGVHIGEKAPTDPRVKVWVDTSEEAGEDAGEYPTRDEMNKAIEALAVPSYAYVYILGGASNWEAEDVTDGSGNIIGCRYGQTVNVNNAVITEHSKVDLLITSEQMVVFYEKDLAFVTENDDGVITVYSVGSIPEHNYKIRAMVTEVVISE